MDKTDRDILAHLRRDARMSVSDLAAATGHSRATIRSRIDNMTARGDIQGFTVVTRADMDEAPVRGLMMLAIEGTGTERLVHELTGWSSVHVVHSTNGHWDLIVELRAETLEALDKILFDIRKLNGVRSSETSLLLTTRRSQRARRDR